MRYLRQSTEVKVPVGPAVLPADGVTPVTGLTLGGADQAEAMKHDAASVTDISGATFAAITSMDGHYNLTLSTSLTDTLGLLRVVIQDADACLPLREDFTIMPENVWDSLFGAAKLEVDVTLIEGSDASDTIDTLATAAVCTEGRLAELDAGNLPTDVAGLATAAVCTEGRLAELDAGNLPADVAGLATAAVCTEGRLAELDAGNLPADIAAVPTVDDIPTLEEIADGLYEDTRYPKYAALIELDPSGLTNDYTVKFLLNGEPITAGITSPTITAIQRSDGATLVDGETLTAISAGWYKYTESSNLLAAGDTALIDVAATYDGGTIKGQRMVPYYET